jgi:glycosyltransferase involved in cell wall biosynthesis
MNVTPTEQDQRALFATSSLAKSISVIVTAMNEEGNLQPTVDSVVRAVAPRFIDYEVIVVDDGSQDGTLAIAESLSAANPRIRVHRNQRNMGLGCSYRIGIGLAAKEYTSWVAGNNMVPQEALERVYDRVGERDMVISYILCDVRGRRRRTLSRAFTLSMNLLFGLRVRYYTGPCVYKSGVAKRLNTRAQGSMLVAEILIRLLRSGQSYVEVGLQPVLRSSGSTKTFRLRNVIDVLASAIALFWELRVRRALTAAPHTEVCVSENDPVVPSR